MRGVDAVRHTAALVGIWRPDPADFDRVNVGGLETVIDVCKTLGTPRSSTRPLPRAPPAARTGAGSQRLSAFEGACPRGRSPCRRERGVPIVTLVPGVIYGPGIDTEGNLVGRLTGIILPDDCQVIGAAMSGRSPTSTMWRTRTWRR